MIQSKLIALLQRNVLTLLLLAIFPVHLSAGELGISGGVAVGASTSPYKDHDNDLTALPVVTYNGNRFYIKGTSAGVHLFKNERHTVSIGASYSPLQFDPDDTDSRPHKLLDRRKSTLMADISYAIITPVGVASAKVSRDVLGYSDGYTADVGFAVPILREKFDIVPSAGAEWSSHKHADYYYGVSRAESARSGLRRHDASANVSPYLGVKGQYRITDRWNAVAGVRVNMLTGDVKNSPMVERTWTVGGFVGGTFSF